MKISEFINYPLGLLGLKIVRKNKWRLANTTDIEYDAAFMEIYTKVKPFTLVEIERCYALYQSVQYIVSNNIPGDFVECGVWKGGSAMLMVYVLQQLGISDRKIYLYDTFEGMTKPGDMDGPNEKKEWESNRVTDSLNTMCYSPIEEVKVNLGSTGYPSQKLVFIKGKVEETIPAEMPRVISLLRLDTDWYESTKHELVHLYPLVSDNGVLLIDDYGAWQGARTAANEYFSTKNPFFMNRIDWTGRLIIKQ
jgi:O-methyltransferase